MELAAFAEVSAGRGRQRAAYPSEVGVPGLVMRAVTGLREVWARPFREASSSDARRTRLADAAVRDAQRARREEALRQSYEVAYFLQGGGW